MSSKLSPQLQKLHELLDGKGFVRLETLYEELMGKKPYSRRAAQQCLTRMFSRYHAAGGEGRIVPGLIRGTYILKRG